MMESDSFAPLELDFLLEEDEDISASDEEAFPISDLDLALDFTIVDTDAHEESEDAELDLDLDLNLDTSDFRLADSDWTMDDTIIASDLDESGPLPLLPAGTGGAGSGPSGWCATSPKAPLCSAAAPARFPELHKAAAKLEPILAEEEELDSDLRCYIQSQRNIGTHMHEVEHFGRLFQQGLQRLQSQEARFLAMYAQAASRDSSMRGQAELAAVQTRTQWANVRMQLKRRFLFVLVTGKHLERASAMDYGDALDNLIFKSFSGEAAVTRNDIEAAQSSGFLKSGVGKTRSNFTKESKQVLRDWFAQHNAHPYPTDQEKTQLCEASGLKFEQVSTWFINERVRNWKKKKSTTKRPRAVDEHTLAPPLKKCA